MIRIICFRPTVSVLSTGSRRNRSCGSISDAVDLKSIRAERLLTTQLTDAQGRRW
jgi:hypothetical protein